MGIRKQANRIQPDRVQKTVTAARAEIERAKIIVSPATAQITEMLGQTPELTAAITADLATEIAARDARLTQLATDEAHLNASSRSTAGLDDAARHALRERAKDAMANAIAVRKGDDILLRNLTQSAHAHRHLGLVSESAVGAEIDEITEEAQAAQVPSGYGHYEEERYEQDDLDAIGRAADAAQIRVEHRARLLMHFVDATRGLPARERMTRIVDETPALRKGLQEAVVARDQARTDARQALATEAYARARAAYHAIIRGTTDATVTGQADSIWLGIGEALYGHDEYDSRTDAGRLSEARGIAGQLEALLAPIVRSQALAVKDPKASLDEAIASRD